MKTVTVCQSCGASIPESLADDAFCTACRYDKRRGKRVQKWDADIPDNPELMSKGKVEFEYPAESAQVPEEVKQRLAELEQSKEALAFANEQLRLGITICLAGRRGTQLSRLAALAALSGLFASQEDAANATGLAPSTLSRETARMRTELAKTAVDATIAV